MGATAGSWVVGVLINICGAVTTNLGTVLMKYHVQVKKGKGRYKLLGIVLFCLGTVLTFTSFSFAAQSLLAGVSAIQFVSNLFFAHWLLNEPYYRKNIIGTVVLIGGMVLLVIGSEKTDNGNSVDDIFDDYYFTVTPHLAFLLSLFGLVCFLAFLFWFRTGVPPFWIRKAPEERLNFELSLPRSQTSFARLVIPSVYVCAAAAVGAQSVVSGKVLSVIMKRVLGDSDWGEMAKWRTYFVLVCWLLAALVWVIHLNRALRVFYGAFIVPLTQVFWTMWTMLSGGIVFGEFAAMVAWQLVLFIIGTLILFFGVSLLAPSKTEGFSRGTSFSVKAPLARNSRESIQRNSQGSSSQAAAEGRNAGANKRRALLLQVTRHITLRATNRSKAPPGDLRGGTMVKRMKPSATFQSYDASTPPFDIDRCRSEPELASAVSLEVGIPDLLRTPQGESRDEVRELPPSVAPAPLLRTGFSGMARELSNAMSVDAMADTRQNMGGETHVIGQVELEVDPQAVLDIKEPPFIRFCKWNKRRLQNRRARAEEMGEEHDYKLCCCFIVKDKLHPVSTDRNTRSTTRSGSDGSHGTTQDPPARSDSFLGPLPSPPPEFDADREASFVAAEQPPKMLRICTDPGPVVAEYLASPQEHPRLPRQDVQMPVELGAIVLEQQPPRAPSSSHTLTPAPTGPAGGLE